MSKTEEKERKRCDKCRFCTIEEKGYSSYTITGEDVTCNLDLHPNAPFDHWENDKLLFWAEECGGFSEGKPTFIPYPDEDGNEIFS